MWRLNLPWFLSLHGEQFSSRSVNTADGARADIRARGFWTSHEDAFFDVRAEHPYVEERILMTCPKPPGPYVSTSAISSVHRTGGELPPMQRQEPR